MQKASQRTKMTTAGRAKESGNQARLQRRGTYKEITKGCGDKIRRVVQKKK